MEMDDISVAKTTVNVCNFVRLVVFMNSVHVVHARVYLELQHGIIQCAILIGIQKSCLIPRYGSVKLTVMLIRH